MDLPVAIPGAFETQPVYNFAADLGPYKIFIFHQNQILVWVCSGNQTHAKVKI